MKGSNNDIIGSLALYSSVGQCYSQVTSNLNRSQQLEGSNNDIIGSLALYSSVGQCYSQVTCNVNRSQQVEVFKQRYNRKLSALFLCRPVLLSGNVQSEQFAAA